MIRKNQNYKAPNLGHEYCKIKKLFPVRHCDFKRKVLSLSVNLKCTIYIKLFRATFSM